MCEWILSEKAAMMLMYLLFDRNSPVKYNAHSREVKQWSWHLGNNDFINPTKAESMGSMQAQGYSGAIRSTYDLLQPWDFALEMSLMRFLLCLT